MKLLSKSGMYGVLACLYLERYGSSGYIAVNEVGRRLKIPYSYLSKLIQSLSSAGVVRTRRGNGGGIALNGASSEILVRQIVEAIEGPFNVPDSIIGNESPKGGLQFTIELDEWNKLRGQIEKMFNTLTLEKLSQTTEITASRFK